MRFVFHDVCCRPETSHGRNSADSFFEDINRLDASEFLLLTEVNGKYNVVRGINPLTNTCPVFSHYVWPKSSDVKGPEQINSHCSMVRSKGAPV